MSYNQESDSTSILLNPEEKKSEGFFSSKNASFIRSIYGEFMGTFLFLLPVLGAVANTYRYNFSPETSTMIVALAGGCQLISVIFCFSSLSGSQLNPAITISLWICNKISNRKCLWNIIAQLLASILLTSCILLSFEEGSNSDFVKALAVIPPSKSSDGKLFFNEFLCTFILTYIAFAIAFEETASENTLSSISSLSLKSIKDKLSGKRNHSVDNGESEAKKKVLPETVSLIYNTTPQSKLGFAPFTIGFTILALSLYGGASGPCMNPARIFGPNLLANSWDKKLILYILG